MIHSETFALQSNWHDSLRALCRDLIDNLHGQDQDKHMDPVPFYCEALMS